jgi:tRNA(adenine34) deaminase
VIVIFEHFMEQALLEAQAAYDKDEVPVGAVVVLNGEIIGRGHNCRETTGDPTMHAEIVAIREAAQSLNSWRLEDCELYVTLEPCPMCAGAIIQSRIERVVFGAFDPKAGCAGTLYNLLTDTRFNHRTEVVPGVFEDKCAELLKRFFKGKRGGDIR